MFLHLRLV